MSRKHAVFISYSTKNADVANKVCNVLEKNGLECWIAPRNIASGKNYIDEISSAIKSAKIIVLIYSKDSQESKYVNNEINLAYSYQKKILSFNIDDSIPKDDMEYYLKVTQWLSAYPNPEDEFETLVKDAFELCDESNDKPILVEIANVDGNNLSKHKKDYLSIILLFTPIYWASFIYMGLSSNKKMWTAAGFVYVIPTLMWFLIIFGVFGYLFILYPMLVLFYVVFVIFWILAIIHGFVIRNEYLTRKAILRFTSTDEDLFNYLYNGYINLR